MWLSPCNSPVIPLYIPCNPLVTNRLPPRYLLARESKRAERADRQPAWRRQASQPDGNGSPIRPKSGETSAAVDRMANLVFSL